MSGNSWTRRAATAPGDGMGREAEQMLDMASSPEVWERPTRSTSWEVRDVIGHLVDTTEGYFESFDVARGKESRSSFPLREMAKYVNEGAVAFRTISQNDLLARLRDDLDQMNGIASELTDEEWAGLLVPHKYMGPLPAAFYPTFQLVDYGVHSWDIRQGSDEAHALAGDTATRSDGVRPVAVDPADPRGPGAIRHRCAGDRGERRGPPGERQPIGHRRRAG